MVPIASDDIGGVQYQIIKLAYGILDAATLVSATNPLPVAAVAGAPAATTGTLTTAASVVPATGLANYASLTAAIYGTHAGVNATFEASPDGTTWFPIQGVRIDAFAAETATGVLTANTARAWDFPIQGFAQFRVRATAWASGTANVVIMPTAFPIEPAPTVGIAAGANTIGTVNEYGANVQVGSDLTWTWAASAALGTAATGTGASEVALPTLLHRDALYVLTVYNPSTVTSLSISVQNRETLSAASRYGELTVVGVPISTSRSFVIQGWFVAEAVRAMATNDIATGAGGGFSAIGRIRRV